MLKGLLVVGVVAIALVSCVAFERGGTWFYRTTDVAIDNSVFHASQSYNDGMRRDLENMRMDYANASPEGKATIAGIARHRFAGYDQSSLSEDDRVFLKGVGL